MDLKKKLDLIFQQLWSAIYHVIGYSTSQTVTSLLILPYFIWQIVQFKFEIITVKSSYFERMAKALEIEVQKSKPKFYHISAAL